MDDDIVLKVDASHSDFRDSVPNSLIEDLERSNKISEYEGNLLKVKIKKLYDSLVNARLQEQSFQKRSKVIHNDILAEKILIEKARGEEVDETHRLQKSGEIRNSLQKELELIEQRDTMAKFELFELKRVHEELKNSLTTMKQQNGNLVNPVIDRLKQEIAELGDQLIATEESYDREVVQKDQLVTTVGELESQLSDKEATAKLKAESLGTAQLEPGRMGRQIASIESAAEAMDLEHRTLLRKIKQHDAEVEVQGRRRAESEKLRRSVLEKLELNRQTLEERELDVAAVAGNLEKAKARGHDLVTQRVEMNVKKREADSQLRHLTDQLGLANKDFDMLKRQLKKKRTVADLARQNLPGLEDQLKDQQALLKNAAEERAGKTRELGKLRDEVDAHIARLLLQEGVESDKKADLEGTIQELDELEATVVHWLAEGKRQAKLLAVLSAQRDIKGRENSRVEGKEREGKQQVRIKELVIGDLTKRCNEISNRLKEFSALYEVVKNERNKYVNLIQSSAQALAEMREKIRILHNEVEILGNERTAKDMALSKERNSHQQAQNQRDALRQDLNRLLSEYRAKQSTVEQQIQEIDKLNVVINNLERDMLQLKGKYERAVEERNVTGVQLIDRNDELCILYERSNQQQEALRRGEVESIRKEAELRLVRLQAEELKRQYSTARKRMPELEQQRTLIHQLEQQLADERRETEALSTKLEDPQNTDRWRKLGGEDADMEQLAAKIQVLEDRLDGKREQLLEKELVLEEVSSLTEKLRAQAVTKRAAAKLLADQLNDLHNRTREVTKKMLASVSELSMYQATALRLQQEKIAREKALEEARWRFDHGQSPSEDAARDLQRAERRRLLQMESQMRREEEMQMAAPNSANMLKTSAEPRPTAYIPDELGIPKPYGSLAPFKPSEQGSSMRHIRPPVNKPIEL